MDFNEKELKLALQALYRLRGDVAGASQEERNKLDSVEKLIGKIENAVGPAKPEKTKFDREIEKDLASAKKSPDSKKK